jgi:hypothetical protein
VIASVATALSKLDLAGGGPLGHSLLPFGVLGVISWTVWCTRRLLTSRYRPAAGNHWEAASVVAPAFREDPQILHRAIESWLVAGRRPRRAPHRTDRDACFSRKAALTSRAGRLQQAGDNSSAPTRTRPPACVPAAYRFRRRFG